MRQLALVEVLEYYDVPQIVVATDVTGTHYLCTLFRDSGSEGYFYLGVQLSEPRLMAFEGGQLDLRSVYLHPEVDNALYLVVAQGGGLVASKLLQPQDVTEEMLPESGFYYDKADVAGDLESPMDTYQLEVPSHDRMTFSTLISRMGWRASSLRKTMGKVAVL